MQGTGRSLSSIITLSSTPPGLHHPLWTPSPSLGSVSHLHSITLSAPSPLSGLSPCAPSPPLDSITPFQPHLSSQLYPIKLHHPL